MALLPRVAGTHAHAINIFGSPDTRSSISILKLVSMAFWKVVYIMFNRMREWVIERLWGWYEFQRLSWLCLRDPHVVRREVLDNVLDLALEIEDGRMMAFMKQLEYMDRDEFKVIH